MHSSTSDGKRGGAEVEGRGELGRPGDAGVGMGVRLLGSGGAGIGDLTGEDLGELVGIWGLESPRKFRGSRGLLCPH